MQKKRSSQLFSAACGAGSVGTLATQLFGFYNKATAARIRKMCIETFTIIAIHKFFHHLTCFRLVCIPRDCQV
jgi:hypothetical protein